jgi:hypothetical protein
MIRLKQLLQEISQDDIQRLLDKIKQKQFRLIGAGDNGRVYEIDGEDKVFKITQERDEIEVASVIVGRWTEFTTFIPVYYVNDRESMFIMANAEPITSADKIHINEFMSRYTRYAREQGGEVSIFDYLDADGARDTDVETVNFLRALQQDIQRTGIEELDLDLDFRADNVMRWNGKMVMVDW